MCYLDRKKAQNFNDRSYYNNLLAGWLTNKQKKTLYSTTDQDSVWVTL
jgi:hypothetical protein